VECRPIYGLTVLNFPLGHGHFCGGGAYETDDGVIVDDYIIVPEILALDGNITTIGVICHELGHVFGLPDLYDID